MYGEDDLVPSHCMSRISTSSRGSQKTAACLLLKGRGIEVQRYFTNRMRKCYCCRMGLGTILILAVGLAIDATAVAAARGLAADRIRVRHVLMVAIGFGGFQALMPAIGWALGAQLGPTVAAWDHWIAFVLLGVIGGKMLWDSFGDAETLETKAEDLFRFRVMLLLSIATSIDALAAGISLPMLNAPFWTSIAVIGIVTALMSATGLLAGRRFGAFFGKRFDAFGGLVLIGIGSKILLEHLSAAGLGS
tara:strand:- start:16707 stop:17450 length:744 start_codon:yes stop_codon:yes gene_type:complete